MRGVSQAPLTGAMSPWCVMNRRASIPQCLLVALTSVVVLAAMYFVFVRTFVGQVVDERGRIGAGRIGLAVAPNAAAVLQVVPAVCAVLLIAVAIVGLMRRRILVTVVAVAVVVAANVTTQLLKHVILVRPNLAATTLVPNSFPSGHVTLAASIALAALLVAPPRWRRAVAVVGGGLVVLIGMLLLAAQWHRPSDVVAGILVVAFWGGVAGAAAGSLSHTPHARTAHVGRGVWLVAAALAAVSLVTVLPVVLAASVQGSHIMLAGVAGLLAVASAGTAASAAAVRTVGVLS